MILIYLSFVEKSFYHDYALFSMLYEFCLHWICIYVNMKIMLIKIKSRIEKEIPAYLNRLNKACRLSRASPLLFNTIREFVSRSGKRIRPMLFIISYLGFTKKCAPGLYSSALSIEFLHDYMLVHDDIIDKSDTRRGKPAMHKVLDDYLKKYKGIKFNGQDLAIVAGDVIYAISLHSFLSIKENPLRKETALKKFIQATIYTGSGEFIELVYGTKNIKDISKEEIFRVYDYKTACYTFATPLAVGAILAGAGKSESDRLFSYGIYLGRAFQIKDDILGMFGHESKIGKSMFTDLKEAKKTILIWYAYNNSGSIIKKEIQKILTKPDAGKNDLLRMRDIMTRSGALESAKNEVLQLIEISKQELARSKMSIKYKSSLDSYSRRILNL
ncbi:MAG: polyprenyl synthetase family protein [Candidatus Omnitrophota bacterium]